MGHLPGFVLTSPRHFFDKLRDFPDEHWEGLDEHGQRLEVDCWDHLHVREAREITLSVIGLTRHGASNKNRDPRVSRFLWQRAAPVPLCEGWATYKRRYTLEHGYRFQKQYLLWAYRCFLTKGDNIFLKGLYKLCCD